MALVPVWAFSFSDTEVEVNETTGNYHAVSNPTGYGSPNAAFNDLDHRINLKKKNVNNVDDETLTAVYNPDPTNGLGEVTAQREVDGWFELTSVKFPIWDVGTAYTANASPGSAHFVSHNSTLYRCMQSNTGEDPENGMPYWQSITLEQILAFNLATFDNNVYVTIEGRVTAFDADVYYANKIAEKTQLGFAGVAQTDRDKKRIDDIYRTIQQVLVADQLGNNTDGEWCVLRLRTMGAKREE